ncbi:uncharacterized protein [Spinacia oleracea]|uniref:Uncharacterized protein n=1 Tax=Spinacia oleracea TaxID=3562 RepID=A0ABM3R4D5_SPIOL|nr:uncharacterized protein LOC110799257 [Spinacia oleracea]
MVRVGAGIEKALRNEILSVLREFKDVFAYTVEEMSGIDPSIMTHHLHIKPEYKPVKQKLRHQGVERNAAAAAEVKKLLEAGFIKECQYSEWLENVVLVKKPTCAWRMCVDFTDLNKACPKDDHPLPKIDRLVDSTAGHALFSFMDANVGYHQIPMAEEDQPHTTFITSQGVYCYKVMPFGLKNAGATYQRFINRIFEGQLGRNVQAYVDDMIVKSKAKADHVTDLRETLSTLRKYGMKINPQKCVFGVKGGKCLGFLVDERGIEANPDKIQAILDMKSPQTIKQVQRLTGCIAARGVSSQEAEIAFQQLKDHLSSLPKLVSPLPGEPLYLYLAMSEYSLSAVLVAEQEKTQHPVYFVSHAYRGAESRYSDIEKLVFALVMARRKLKPYFQAHPIKVLTSQPIRKIIEGRNHSSRMTDWDDQLADFGLEYEPRRAIKAQALADFIAECTNRPEQSLDSTPWILNVDGSSSKSGSGAGILIVSPSGERFEYAVKFDFNASNNEAEYEALILGLELWQVAGASAIHVFSDSQLIVGQMTGEYVAKEDSMRMYLNKAKNMSTALAEFQIQHVPRGENTQADALARMASSAEGLTPRTIMWEVLRKPSINKPAVNYLDRSNTWMDQIIAYKRSQELPEDEKEAAQKSYTHPLLKCITPEDGDYVLREIHQGACGSHQGSRTTAGKALRAGFYWPTLQADAEKLVRHCEKCQKYAQVQHLPSNKLTAIIATLPFDQWGMDLLGPFLAATGQRKFLLVAIDYFTKWIEAEPLASITDKQIQKFIWRNIITRFGVPRALISDNERQFNSKPTVAYCKQFAIRTYLSAVSRPQTNGQAEAANKIILHGLRTMLEGSKGTWVDDLPGVLWSARTTNKDATGRSPFELVYGSEAVLPVEVGIPSPRVTFYDYEENEKKKSHDLDLLPEIRGDALLRAIAQKRKMTRHFNRRVKHKPINQGDWVLRNI